jgi:hypothetical protein
MKKTIPLAVLTITLGLAGCSSSEPPAPAVSSASTEEAVKVSSPCAEAVEKQGKEGEEVRAIATVDTLESVLNAPYVYPLEDCQSFADYSKAGVENPGAWGMKWHKEEDMERTVMIACFQIDPKSTTPVCADAKQLGLLS